MRRSPHCRVLLATVAATLGAAITPALGTAVARAASLSVTVAPVRVHPGQRYQVSVTGSFRKSELTGTAYVLAFLQYGEGACKATAQAEYQLPVGDWDWDFRGRVLKSPFVRTVPWTAHTRRGRRRVCAYLYSEVIGPDSALNPIARAHAQFRNV